MQRHDIALACCRPNMKQPQLRYENDLSVRGNGHYYGSSSPSGVPLMKRTLFTLTLVVPMVAGSSAKAQDVPGMARPPILIQQAKRVPYRDNLVSLNPIGVVLQYYTAQFEHALSP